MNQITITPAKALLPKGINVIDYTIDLFECIIMYNDYLMNVVVDDKPIAYINPSYLTRQIQEYQNAFHILSIYG
jgi:hypothetical protein